MVMQRRTGTLPYSECVTIPGLQRSQANVLALRPGNGPCLLRFLRLRQRVGVAAKVRRHRDRIGRPRQPIITDLGRLAALAGIDHLGQQRHAGRPRSRMSGWPRRHIGRTAWFGRHRLETEPTHHARQVANRIPRWREGWSGGGFRVPGHSCNMNRFSQTRFDAAQWSLIPVATSRPKTKKGCPEGQPFHCQTVARSAGGVQNRRRVSQIIQSQTICLGYLTWPSAEARIQFTNAGDDGDRQ